MMIVAFLCFIALIAAWLIAPKETGTVEAPATVKTEAAVPVAS
jgi:hypothetical protein